MTRVSHGTKVEVLGSEGEFYRVRIGNIEGYAAKAYIKLDSSETGAPTERPTSSTTPKPTTSSKPTERPTAGAKYATVIKADGLALHETEQGATIRTIPNYGVVQVLHVYGQWSHVSYEGSVGYVENKYLKPGIIKPEGSTLKARVTLSSSSQMYLRSAKSTSSAPVTMVPNGATVDVIERDNTWAKVKYGGRTGYCMTKFLTILA